MESARPVLSCRGFGGRGEAVGCCSCGLRLRLRLRLRDHARLSAARVGGVAWRGGTSTGTPDSGGAGRTKAAACGGGSEAVRGAADALWALPPLLLDVNCDVPMVWASCCLVSPSLRCWLVDGKNRKCVAAAATWRGHCCVLSGCCRHSSRRQTFKNSKLCTLILYFWLTRCMP
jgi:hypothetical protein